jgi:hypothetical protein
MHMKLELIPLPVSDDRGVPISEIHDFGGGVKGAEFSDPDGNTLELQEMTWRKGAAY